MDCITYQLTTVVEKEIEMEQITKLIIKEANITFFQLKKDIGRKKKDYNEKLSLLGICLFLEQTSMQKLKKECGLTMKKTVLNQEVNGLIIMIHTLNITCKIAPCDMRHQGEPLTCLVLAAVN